MNISRVPRALLAVVCLLTPLAAAGPFDTDGKPPTAATVTITEARPAEIDPRQTSPMLDHLQGVIARLDAKAAQELRATSGGPSVPLPQNTTRFCVVHVGTKAAPKAVEVLRDDQGAYFARDLYAPDEPNGKPRAVRLNGPKFAKIAATFSKYRGHFAHTQDDPTPAKVADLAGALTPSPFTFDKDVMSERMNGGAYTRLEPTKRVLDDSKFAIRLPKTHNPRLASGLLVYIDPAQRGDVYDFMHAIADELNLIVIAPRRIGNDVYAPDRWQLGMDAIATASARWLVDPGRIYITGISGGGQISTHLWLCFPDIISGAVPIVALGSYENIPIGNGKMWMHTFGKPKAEFLKLAKTQRGSAITGKLDFNERPIQLAAAILQKAGLNVRVESYADMGHTAPTSGRFGDALKWVDAPQKLKRDGAQTEAQLRLATVSAEPDPAKRRETLVEVTRILPWSDAAWEAVKELDPSLIPK
jgi:hypothetical protein